VGERVHARGPPRTFDGEDAVAVALRVERTKGLQHELAACGGQWAARCAQELVVIDGARAVVVKVVEELRHLIRAQPELAHADAPGKLVEVERAVAVLVAQPKVAREPTDATGARTTDGGAASMPRLAAAANVGFGSPRRHLTPSTSAVRNLMAARSFSRIFSASTTCSITAVGS
jgi:hypothetical protein